MWMKKWGQQNRDVKMRRKNADDKFFCQVGLTVCN